MCIRDRYKSHPTSLSLFNLMQASLILLIDLIELGELKPFFKIGEILIVGIKFFLFIIGYLPGTTGIPKNTFTACMAAHLFIVGSVIIESGSL